MATWRAASVVLLGGMMSALAGGQVDLAKRYPTTLTAERMSAVEACAWTFDAADLYRLEGFALLYGDELALNVDQGWLGIGHCAEGAVWAVLVPDEPGLIQSVAAPGQSEAVAHLWLRFHPKLIGALFPAERVRAGRRAGLAEKAAVLRVAGHKMFGSYQANGAALIPAPEQMVVDLDTTGAARRFFTVDRSREQVAYIAAFAGRGVPADVAVTEDQARQALAEVWTAFDREYAMFVLRPEVDWTALRNEHAERIATARSAYALGVGLAEMLAPLRDLHVWVRANGQNVRVYERARRLNANPQAWAKLVGTLRPGRGSVQWARTDDGIGYVGIHGLSDRAIPQQVDRALEELRDTRGLIVDLRLNGGGDERLAQQVAGRFVEREAIYAHSQYRDGPKHDDLSAYQARRVSPRGPWRYEPPVVVLTGRRTMSSGESFVAMLATAANVTTMGAPTAGSSGNPRMIETQAGVTVSVPRWLDRLADGTPLDERGIVPDVVVEAVAGGLEGERDAVLEAALGRLRG